MSQIAGTMCGEAQLRYEMAQTVEDWKGCYAWAVGAMTELRRSETALENVLKQYVNYAEDGVTEEVMKKYASELKKLAADEEFKKPDFLKNPPEDPVLGKILKYSRPEERE